MENVILFVSILFGTLICGALGLAVGRTRGRGTAGFWLGFLLGPLGIVIVLLLPAAISATPSGSAPAPTRPGILCGMCGRRVPFGSSACPDCGTAVSFR